MVQYEIKITGRVQGVGFRYYTQKQARILGLKGWVKNTSDGGVLVLAQGSREMIDTFIDYLRIGPTPAHVRNVSATPLTPTESYSDFTVRY